MNILDKFNKVTSYDLYQYFTDYGDFLDTQFKQLVAYYKGNSSVDKHAFTELNRLYKESLKIEGIISSLSSSLSSTTEFWDLNDNLSIIKTKLESTLNLAKWMRSSYIYGYENQSKVKYIVKQNQTLENVSFSLGSSTPNEDWVGVAVENGISEMDYTSKGGNILDVKKEDNSTFNITTVVDVMVGDNILGKDIQRKLEITEEDIVTLNTVDTMNQSAEICLTTVRGSVPEFVYLGISKDFVGSALQSLRLASLSREVINNFKTDDSFKSVQLISNEVEQDNAFYEFRIESRLHHELNKTL